MSFNAKKQRAAVILYRESEMAVIDIAEILGVDPKNLIDFIHDYKSRERPSLTWQELHGADATEGFECYLQKMGK